MRIALVTPVPPLPADSGTRIRLNQIIRFLSRRYEIAVLVLLAGDAASVSKQLGVPVTFHPVKARRGVSPITFDEATTRAVWQFAAEWKADVLQVAMPFAAAAAGLPHMQPPLPVILDEGCFHHLRFLREARWAPTVATRARALFRWWRLRRFERQLATVVHTVVVVSEDEVAMLRQLEPTARVVVVPNGVDTNAVYPSPPGDALLFVGLLSYAPNRDAVRFFVTEILPRLSPASRDLEFLVAGNDPGSDLEDLARKEPRLRLLGFVPDLQPVYNRAAVFVNPMRGGMGTRLKVLEAMAAGKPVVSTTVGAEGLDFTPGRELLLADSPAAFAETIQGLLADADRACEIGQAGRALVEARYRWETCLAPFEKVYKELSFRHG